MGYGTGLNGSLRQYLLKGWRYLWFPKKVLGRIIQLLRNERADLICLLEADTGSFRTRFHSQVTEMVRGLGLPFYASLCKYSPRSLWSRLPVFRKQHTGMMSKKEGQMMAHYLTFGMKRLVEEMIVDGMSIFVVHLGRLSKNVRRHQLRELGLILQKCPRPYVVCGDFNIFKGLSEVRGFMEENQLRRVEHAASFPSVQPKKSLDLFFTSPGVQIKRAGVVQSELSDHLPVWVEVRTTAG